MAAGTPHLGWCFRSSVWSGRPYQRIARGLLHLLGCTVRCAMGCRGVVRAPTSEAVHTSYRSGCGSISGSLGRTTMTLGYVISSFLLYIIYVNYLANNLEFTLQLWPFDDDDTTSRPLLGHRWSKITHLTGTIEGRYMTYSNAFDCISSGQVRQHLFTC
jgi:hypothetical protein